MEGVQPAWQFVLSGVTLWAYSTMDNMDGKQARRTGSGSSLGLLFDHGCDAINAGVLSATTFCCALSVSSVPACFPHRLRLATPGMRTWFGQLSSLPSSLRRGKSIT